MDRRRRARRRRLLDTVAYLRGGRRRRPLPARPRGRPRRAPRTPTGWPRALDGWTVFPQRGDGLAERLANVAPRPGRRAGRPGRPDRHGHPAGHRPRDLTAVIDGLADRRRGAGRRRGRRLVGARRWRDPRRGEHLVGVPMSTPTTGALHPGGVRGRRPRRWAAARCCATSTPSTTPRPWPRSAPRARSSPRCWRRSPWLTWRPTVEAVFADRLPRPSRACSPDRASPGSTCPPTRGRDRSTATTRCSTSARARPSTSAAARAG